MHSQDLAQLDLRSNGVYTVGFNGMMTIRLLSKNTRNYIEDKDILQALNDALPSTPHLVHPDNPDFTSAVTEAEQLVTAAFYYIFGGRNASLT